MSGGLLQAGSQKGSMLLAEIRRKYPSYHPILAIVDLAHKEGITDELAFNCHKTVAKYVEPELKSIEVKGDFKTQQSVRVSLFGEPEVETVPFTEAGAFTQVENAVASAIEQGGFANSDGFGVSSYDLP